MRGEQRSAGAASTACLHDACCVELAVTPYSLSLQLSLALVLVGVLVALDGVRSLRKGVCI
jgi:hypothetical protein